MKTIYKDEYQNDGIFINLEITPYQKLLSDPDKYLDKCNKYYIYCHGGIKSARVVTSLEQCGYDVVRVIRR